MRKLATPTTTDGTDSGDGVTTADGADPDSASSAADTADVAGTVRYRLRDLDRRGRSVAAVFAVALLLAPMLAFVWAAPDWVPTGDPALMALRALDVGTSRTPVTGQPSTSGLYGGSARHVDHLGPVHFYLLAGPVRLFGAALGMLLVSMAMTGASVLVAAWAVFRQLGAAGGLAAAVLLGAITFTTGAASLVNPVSSNIAGYPMLCSMVLLWCLLCGDLRLLPLAVGFVSFTAQQHLSVLPALLLATLLASAIVAAREARGPGWRDPAGRRRVLSWVGVATALGLVLWSPVLLQQALGHPGNLGRVAEFAGDSDKATLGYGSAFGQVAHVLGLPPLLGQRDLSGQWLQTDPSPLTWTVAAIVVAVTALVGWRLRRSQPRRAALATMAGLVAVGGLVGGASVPTGAEQYRLVFFHWSWPLIFLVGLSLGLALLDLARGSGRVRRSPAAWAAAGTVLALALIVGPSLLNPSVDRVSNRLVSAYVPIERRFVEQLTDEVLARREELGDAPVMLGLGDSTFIPVRHAVTVELIEAGVDVRQSLGLRTFVHDDHLVDPDSESRGLVLVVNDEVEDLPSDAELLAEVVTSEAEFAWATRLRIYLIENP